MENIDKDLPNSNNQSATGADDLKDTAPEISSPVKFSRLQIGLAVLCFLLIISAIVIMSFSRPSNQIPSVSESPRQATQSASIIPKEISEFAKSQGFLVFEKNLINLQELNDKVDLYESKLSFPLLDMNVNFDKN